MPANTAPIYGRTPDVQWVESCTVANNNIDITSGTSYLVFTADATEGGYVDEIRILPNPAQNTAASTAVFWLNNGSTTGTASNSAIIGNIGIPATTASATAAMPEFIYSVKKAIPPGYRIYVTFKTAPGGSGEFTVTAFGSKY